MRYYTETIELFEKFNDMNNYVFRLEIETYPDIIFSFNYQKKCLITNVDFTNFMKSVLRYLYEVGSGELKLEIQSNIIGSDYYYYYNLLYVCLGRNKIVSYNMLKEWEDEFKMLKELKK